MLRVCEAPALGAGSFGVARLGQVGQRWRAERESVQMSTGGATQGPYEDLIVVVVGSSSSNSSNSSSDLSAHPNSSKRLEISV